MKEKKPKETLELRFDSCSGIIIPASAIIDCYIEEGDKYEDGTNLKSARIIIDLKNEDEFETYQYEESVKARNETLEEFHSDSDITHIYIDGEEFRPPWKPDVMFTNPWQQNMRVYDSLGNDHLIITIAPVSDEVCIYVRSETDKH